AGAVRAHDGDELALGHLEGQAFEGMQAAVGDAKAGDLEHRSPLPLPPRCAARASACPDTPRSPPDSASPRPGVPPRPVGPDRARPAGPPALPAPGWCAR